MKYQSLFSGKNKINIKKCCLLKFLPSTLSIQGMDTSNGYSSDIEIIASLLGGGWGGVGEVVATLEGKKAIPFFKSSSHCNFLKGFKYYRCYYLYSKVVSLGKIFHVYPFSLKSMVQLFKASLA